MKIEIDLDKCIGAGQCVEAAPNVFSQDEITGLARAPKDVSDPGQFGPVRHAEHSCPARAIRATD